LTEHFVLSDALASTKIAACPRTSPMIDHLYRPPDSWLARVLGNAGLLALAILTVTSLGLGRYAQALVWLGALLVVFVHTCEAGRQAAQRALPRPAARRADAVRFVGAACALIGVTLGLL
jgi:hypothetical protein